MSAIYLISSYNDFTLVSLVVFLRDLGYEVYDFIETKDGLVSYNQDVKALELADAAIAVFPCSTLLFLNLNS